MAVVLSIDAGTTGTRTLAIDEHGQVRRSAYREFTQHFPQPGWVEHEVGVVGGPDLVGPGPDHDPPVGQRDEVRVAGEEQEVDLWTRERNPGETAREERLADGQAPAGRVVDSSLCLHIARVSGGWRGTAGWAHANWDAHRRR